MKLADVPPRIFSEVMRDIDLVVSVAHRGQVDPEATASTTQMRAALARETCELLGLTNVQFQTTHAIIRGHYAEYSLHLGSGTVHRLPGGSIAIIPVHAQHRGRIFLPFADNDPKTAEILSKVLLLARDQEIQDPTILAQLGAPPIQIAPHEQVRKQKTIQTTRSDDVAAHDIEATDASQPIDDIATASITRRYELSEGSANKFWEIEISGKSITTRWGRIGSNGQSKTKAFETESAAKSELEKLIKEKTGKGYGEC
jgi:predicted DNA-binding WGR domain protein